MTTNRFEGKCPVNTAPSWDTSTASRMCGQPTVARVIFASNPSSHGMPVCAGHTTGWGADDTIAWDA